MKPGDYRGREAAATLWEPITPNSWELSTYDAVSVGNGAGGGSGWKSRWRPTLPGAWGVSGPGTPSGKPGQEHGFFHSTSSEHS